MSYLQEYLTQSVGTKLGCQSRDAAVLCFEVIMKQPGNAMSNLHEFDAEVTQVALKA